jgi:hypothetical protein
MAVVRNVGGVEALTSTLHMEIIFSYSKYREVLLSPESLKGFVVAAAVVERTFLGRPKPASRQGL